jgi:hypothetical protein
VHEIGRPDQQGDAAQEPLPPQPGDPLQDLGAQPGPRPLAPLLELRAHQQQGGERHRVGDGVEGERQELADPEQQAAERLAGEVGALVPRLVLGDGLGELRLGDHVGQRCRLGELEEDVQAPLDEGDQRDLEQRQPVQRQGDGDAAQRQGAAAVGGEHHPLAVPAVDQRSRGQVQQQERQGLREADHPSLGRRAGQGQHQQGIGERGDARADGRDHLPAPQQEEVAIATQ